MNPGHVYYFMFADKDVELQARGIGHDLAIVVAKSEKSIMTEEGSKRVWEELPREKQYMINLLTLERVDDNRTS